MNLLERLKPEVLVVLNKLADRYPISGGQLIKALEMEEYVCNLRYGYVVELLSLVPYKDNQSPYDLFLEE